LKIDKNKIEFFFFKFFEKLVHVVGLRRIKFIARPLAFFFYRVIPLRKNVVLKNLRMAFPELSGKEIKKIAYENYVNAAITFMELLYGSKITLKELNELIVIDNSTKAKLIEIAKRNTGAIFLSGHFGNWEILSLYVGSLINEIKPVHILVKRQRNRFITEWLETTRSKFGNKIVEVGIYHIYTVDFKIAFPGSTV